ncbi:hypothetical protein QOZ80_1BG0096850 [Eleusine coracana subsp. coracana]|nr:hypothetical protein QOZ80_1BG0096850 [Eleusine coracana subsp. coracana]
MTMNSSNVRTPSPLRSNLQIMARQSSMPCSEPRRPSIRFRLVGVMQPCPSISYMPNASLSPRRRSSSAITSAAETSLTNSSPSRSPSPSASTEATSASASAAETSSPSVVFMHTRSSDGEIRPSESLSNAANSVTSSLGNEWQTTIFDLSICYIDWPAEC